MRNFAVKICFLFLCLFLFLTCAVDNNSQVNSLPQTIVWKGSFASADEIENPEYLWAYYNTTDGCSYIYDGEKWTLLASSGKNGLDGKDGTNGKDGLDGKDGTNGKDGLDGKNGLDSKNGTDGTDGVNARVVILYVLNGGTLPEDAPLIYTYGSKTPLKLIAPQKSRFNFAGFYYNSDFTGPKVTELDNTYAYGQVLFAKWCYTVTLNYNDGREVTTETIYDFTTGYTPDTPVRKGYTFDGWYTDENFSDETKISSLSPEYGNVNLYALWINNESLYVHDEFDTITILPAGTNGTAGPDWTYVEFGMWPQTIKQAGITVDESITLERGDFTYYMGSDGAWYVKVTEDPYSDSYMYSDGTPVSEGSNTYFKVEPIKWRVLTNEYLDYGAASVEYGYERRTLLLAENILAERKYESSKLIRSGGKNLYKLLSNGAEFQVTKGSSGNIYPNEFEYSEIRSWLNGCDFLKRNRNVDKMFQNKGFVDIAFNNISSCCIPRYTDELHGYFWINYAFLLSLSEATNESYGFTASNVVCDARKRTPTDYAIANNAVITYGWWLRNETIQDCYVDSNGDPSPSAQKADIVTNSSKLSSAPVIGRAGIVPAIAVNLSEYY